MAPVNPPPVSPLPRPNLANGSTTTTEKKRTTTLATTSKRGKDDEISTSNKNSRKLEQQQNGHAKATHQSPATNNTSFGDDDEIVEETAPEPIKRSVPVPVQRRANNRTVIPPPPPAAPLAAAAAAKSNALKTTIAAAAYADNDAFEAYEDDFEEEFLDDDDNTPTSSSIPPVRSEKKHANEPPPQVPPVLAPIIPTKTDDRTKPPQTDDTFITRLDHDRKQQRQQHLGATTAVGGVDFRSAQQARAASAQHIAAARRLAKFNAIAKLVLFEKTHHRHFTLTPASSHARYLELFGKQNVKLAACQTAEERSEREMQTEMPEQFHAWTQHPALSSNQVCGRHAAADINPYGEGISSLFSTKTSGAAEPKFELPSANTILTFITQASECILKVITEQQQQQQSNGSINSTVRQNPNVLSLEGKSEVFSSIAFVSPEPSAENVTFLACNEPKMTFIATCHSQLPSTIIATTTTTTPTTNKYFQSTSVILIWLSNTSSPNSPPLAVLYTHDNNSRIECCLFHPLDASIVIAGCSDGSLQCWLMQKAQSSSYDTNAARVDFQHQRSAAAAFTSVPLLAADFSSAPMGGSFAARLPSDGASLINNTIPTHMAPIVSLHMLHDVNSAHRVGIAGTASTCTLASLDASSLLCLWNVVLLSSSTSNSNANPAFSSARSENINQAKRRSGTETNSSTANGVLDAVQQTVVETKDFCISPQPFSLSKTSSSAETSSTTTGINLIPIFNINITTSSVSRRNLFTTSLSYSLSGQVQFSPYYARGGGYTLACLVDGRLYRVCTKPHRRTSGKVAENVEEINSGTTTASITDGSIAAFTFPTPAAVNSAATTTTMSSSSLSALIRRQILVCAHASGVVTIVSLDTGQQLACWSSPLMSTANLFFPSSPTLAGGNYFESSSSVHSIWWPDRNFIILVGANSLIVKYEFDADNIDEYCLGQMPTMQVEVSMSKGVNSKCIGVYAGGNDRNEEADSSTRNLAILARGSPLTFLELKRGV